MVPHRRLGFIAALTIASLSCVTEPQLLSLDPSLQRIFFWGEFSRPNAGYPTVSLYNPTWIDTSSILAFTGERFGLDSVLVGLFEFKFDPKSLEYLSHAGYRFDRHVWTIGFDYTSGRALVVSVADDDVPRVSAVTLDNAEVREEIVVPSEWSPWGVATSRSFPGIVFYGEDPATRIAGFYVHRVTPSAGARDSLLLQRSLTRDDARGLSLSADGTKLFFLEGDSNVMFYSYDLLADRSVPQVIAQRAGGIGNTAPHPLDPDLLLINYTFPGDAHRAPGTHVELVRLSTQTATELDIRTGMFEGDFSLADHPCWRPDGQGFCFAGRYFNGEAAGGTAWSLWYRAVP